MLPYWSKVIPPPPLGYYLPARTPVIINVINNLPPPPATTTTTGTQTDITDGYSPASPLVYTPMSPLYPPPISCYLSSHIQCDSCRPRDSPSWTYPPSPENNALGSSGRWETDSEDRWSVTPSRWSVGSLPTTEKNTPLINHPWSAIEGEEEEDVPLPIPPPIPPPIPAPIPPQPKMFITSRLQNRRCF